MSTITKSKADTLPAQVDRIAAEQSVPAGSGIAATETQALNDPDQVVAPIEGNHSIQGENISKMEATKEREAVKTIKEEKAAPEIIAGATAPKETHQNGRERDKDAMPIRIYAAWCKGCGICAAFCPKGVLEMDPAEQKAVVRNPQLCIQCGLCELRCPDLAITRVAKRTDGNGKTRIE